MEITGRIIWISPEKRGVSKNTGREWVAKDYVIECKAAGSTTNFIYNLFGDINGEHQNTLGSLVTVSYTTNAKEWNGRWYGENKAFKTVACEGINHVATWQRLDYERDFPSGVSASDLEGLASAAAAAARKEKTESPVTYDEATPYAANQALREQPSAQYDDLPF